MVPRAPTWGSGSRTDSRSVGPAGSGPERAQTANAANATLVAVSTHVATRQREDVVRRPDALFAGGLLRDM